MRYAILLDRDAVEDLRGLRAGDRARVRDAIEEHLRFEPEKSSQSRIKRLRDLRHPQYRLRVGDFRIFYDVIDERVEVFAILTKAEVALWLGEKGERE